MEILFAFLQHAGRISTTISRIFRTVKIE